MHGRKFPAQSLKPGLQLFSSLFSRSKFKARIAALFFSIFMLVSSSQPVYLN
jgi:hypothetical protein